MTDEHGAYAEQIITVTVNGSNDDLRGDGDEIVTLLEDDLAIGTLQDYVSDPDDVLIVTEFKVDSNGDGIVETFGPGTNVTLSDSGGNGLGTLTIAENGDYTFTPAPNYGGKVPVVTYTMTESGKVGGPTVTQSLTFEITKVADAPTLEDDKAVSTDEDTAVSLGLVAPVLTDEGTGTGNDDHPERLGEITLTLGGAGADGVTFSTGTTVLTPVGGTLTIVLTDGPGDYHIADMPVANSSTGVYHLTTDEYEALVANPTPESGQNFTVTVSATSYEVDSSGAILPGVDGAANEQVINVDVLAVTDGATLTISDENQSVAEDTAFDVASLLAATLTDTDDNTGFDEDGSETYWYTVTGLPVGAVVTIGGVDTTISSTDEEVSSEPSVSEEPPTITIKPPLDFSGNMDGITITLNSQDTDGDSLSHTPEIITSEVTLNLHVTPVAGDVSVSDVTTAEDTAVAFLEGVTVTDTNDGSEVIDSVSFTVPTDWIVTPPEPSAGWSYNLTGSTATITFVEGGLTEAAREAILDDFMIAPPAHSSKDETITLTIETTDSNGSDTHTDTVDRDVKITVTPVAERTDEDSDGENGNDVTMIDDHAYTSAGKEDEWFALGQIDTGASNTGGGWDLLHEDWSNEDTDEFVYAVLTPTLTSDYADDSVTETQFRYSTNGGETWVIQDYVGEAIWVPQPYLDTLQVKLPPDVSGTLEISVKAGTVDYDDDAEVTEQPLNPPVVSGPGVNVEISGEAILSLIKFEPVADAVTMQLGARASGREDTEIPLVIEPTSSDDSETFNVTISGIPEGAKITYEGTELTVTGGSVTIEDFSNTAPLSITPPPNSNKDFTLTVSAVSVDGADTSDPTADRTISVAVTGVADEATVNLASDYSVSEAELDGGGNTVALSNLVESVVSDDTDGSEAVTVRVSGLTEEFSISGATMVVSGTGIERVWSVSADKLAAAFVVLPKNYSGTVDLQMTPVTTENDGDSLTAKTSTPVSFTVTPSPEATITANTVLVEDEVTNLSFAIEHQNGDANERLGQIYIAADNATGADYTLYFGGVALGSSSGVSLTSISDDTVLPDGDYYVIQADQIENLGALGAPNRDGDLGALDFYYEVIDPSSDGTLGSVTEIKPGTLELTATPVTDTVDVSITAIEMTTATGDTDDVIVDDDATPDTATVTSGGSVTVNLHVASEDTDGSEHLIRILIEDVPDGVTVTGASPVGGGSWLLVYDADNPNSIGASGIDVPVEFVVGAGAANGLSSIKMTVQAQDWGDDGTTLADDIESDSVSWDLNLDLGGGDGAEPPVIDQWVYEYNGTAGEEDESFTLGSVINAEVSTNSTTEAYTYTVTITDLLLGSTVEGMVLTTIEGKPVYTATVTVEPGEDSQAALEGLLNDIEITPPENSNSNNAVFEFDAKLTAAAVGGLSVEEDTDTGSGMPVTPVTDPAKITVATSDVDEGETSITATITVDRGVDGADGKIVDGKLYVQVSTSGNDGGTVSDGVGVLTPTTVSGVAGITDGEYYVIDVGEEGGSVELVYTAAGETKLQPGDVTFTAHTQTQETGASNIESASASDTAKVNIINNGVTVQFESVTGDEAASSDQDNAIEITGLSVTLIDSDSESIKSVLLSGVPVGFLLFTGEDAGDASLAAQSSNAGGDGITNTWIVSDDGSLPNYVAILPPANWSGTLSGLALVVESGEDSLPTTEVETFPIGSVTVEAVANGVTINPTLSFGREGKIIALNLNAAMADAKPATASVSDESTETTMLQLTGLGQYASFYVGGDQLDESQVSYDETIDVYTLTGLSQDDLHRLGFIQAKSALSGSSIDVEAWTVESGNNAESARVNSTITLNVSKQLATTNDDTLIWTGEKINGRGGDDTVQIRYGENLTGEKLAEMLTNIEVIDLRIGGKNAITDLSAEQVGDIVGNTNRLTIKGTSDDEVTLGEGWVDNDDGTYTGTYTIGETEREVTLAVDGDVTVVMPDSSTSTSGTGFSAQSFGGFGLEGLDSEDDDSADDFLFGHDADPLDLDGMLQSEPEAGDDDFGQWLPNSGSEEGHAGGEALTASFDPDSYEAYAPEATPLEDELRNSLQDAHVAG